MVVDKTPPINATGRYILRAPWTVDPNASYKCESISGFEALAKMNINPYVSYYQPMQASYESYMEDKAAGINIITLMSGEGNTIFVPSSYILQYPNEFDVPYGRVVVSINLGPLPADFPLNDIKSKMISIAVATTGNSNITVNTHFLPISTFVTKDMETSLAEARSDKIDEAITTYGSKLMSEQEVAKLIDRKDALEEILKDKLGFG